jgi:hypothetical protein
MLQMYQDAARMPICTLRNGKCVHIQEGAFLPPPKGGVGARGAPGAAAGAPTQRVAAAAVTAAAAAAPGPQQQAGLGEEAREFIMKQLPLFQVGAGLCTDPFALCLLAICAK